MAEAIGEAIAAALVAWLCWLGAALGGGPESQPAPVPPPARTEVPAEAERPGWVPSDERGPGCVRDYAAEQVYADGPRWQCPAD